MLRLLPLAALLVALALPATASAAKRTLYVSIGDSYAAGYQPPSEGRAGGYTGRGFADQLTPMARKAGYRGLRLVNYGCGGETTTSLIEGGGPNCTRGAGERTGYRGDPQLDAAERFLRRSRRRIAFVTVSIGGNDVTRCARGGVEPVACVAAAVAGIQKNVTATAKRIREAVGKGVPVIGITYPDVILGRWLGGTDSDRSLARLSLLAFEDFINPSLRKAYASAGGRFVDVTRATDAYTPLERTTTHPRYGQIPVAVARVCELTWFCALGDIHANDKGYRAIAKLVAARLPKVRARARKG